MLTGFGMCVVCVRKYACVCVFTFLGLLGDHCVFFRIFPKVDKVDLARSSQNRGLRFEIQMYVLAEKRVKKFQIQKAKEQPPPPSFVSNLLTFRTLSERGR